MNRRDFIANVGAGFAVVMLGGCGFMSQDKLPQNSALLATTLMEGGTTMPVITVEAGQLTNAQKRELVVTLTKDAANIMKHPAEHFIVLIKENSRDNIGFGGVWLAEK